MYIILYMIYVCKYDSYSLQVIVLINGGGMIYKQ